MCTTWFHFSHLWNAPLKFYQTKHNIDIKISQLITQLAWQSKSYQGDFHIFHAVPTGTWAHSCPFLGRELTIPTFTITLSKYTHSIFSHTCIQQSFVFTMHIYIIKKARESSKSFSPLCFVPSWNPHHRCGFSCSQPLSLHCECWTNPSWSWHLVSLVYFRPLNHGVSPHGLSWLLGPPQSY